jgi:NADPH:quinone reductase-like Zn-dependent oxidoreductase
MKAVVFDKEGGPENLYMGDFPAPTPGPGEITIRVAACSINHLDFWVLKRIPAYKTTMPHAMGADVAGLVEDVGEGVTDYRKGDAVVVDPVVSCGNCEWCGKGLDNRCESRHILGAGPLWGGYAEVVKVPARNAVNIPKTISMEEAAAIPVTFLTSWHMLVNQAGVNPEKTVLVLGAGSGIGVASISIARMAGARVIATASSEDKRQKAKALGAESVLDHTEPHLAARIRELTGGRGVDIVVEHIGPVTFKESIMSLAPGGTLVTCGATTGPEAAVELRYLFSKELTVKGAYLGTLAEFNDLMDAFGRKLLRPVIDSVFPVGEAARALAHLESRKSFGKIILKH